MGNLPSMPLRSGDVFAGYTVVRELGTGRTGEVYLAAHPRTLRQDALRVLPAATSADAQFRARFQQRVDAAATLWHPHIVGVHEHGEDQGRLWLAMDFVDGTDAGALIRDRYDTGLPADQVLDIVTSIADALDHAHARRCVHGDVTAASILLTDHPRRRILLTDFGTPRGLDDDAFGSRADQYGLAATAHHLLSGAVPTGPLGATRQDLAAFDPALQRAMSSDPRQRFGACLDLAAALRDAATAATQAQPVFVPAWSAEEPTPEPALDGLEPEFEPASAPTMAAMRVTAEPATHRPGRIWIVTAVAALVALIVVLVVVVARGGGDGAAPSASSAKPSTAASTTATTATGVGGRPRPATIRGADPTGDSCEGGYQITGQAGWASQGVRASPEATCSFVSSVLKAYWDAADPSRDPRSVVAAGAIPCGAGAACIGNDFLVTCSAEGADPWITCRGGRGAVVVLY
jgi:serine/threonine-protein kinase